MWKDDKYSAFRNYKAVSTRLARCFKRATLAVVKYDSIDIAEPAIEALLQLIKRHPEERPFVAALFISSFASVVGCLPVIQYCMHELRWKEILDYCVLQRASAVGSDTLWFWDSLINSFSERWEDADLFQRFRSK